MEYAVSITYFNWDLSGEILHAFIVCSYQAWDEMRIEKELQVIYGLKATYGTGGDVVPEVYGLIKPLTSGTILTPVPYVAFQFSCSYVNSISFHALRWITIDS